MKYVNAKSSKEAMDALISAEGKAVLISGGSDVMVDMHAGKLSADCLVDVTKAEDMLGIRIEGNEIVIGASTTLTDIQTNEIIKKYYPSLSKGAGSVGSKQIRNSATLTGNVVSAQPAADAAMAVSPLDPTFVVITKDGEKTMKMNEMYVGFGKSAIDHSAEIIKEVRIPVPADDEKAACIRLELRKSLSLPMLVASAMAKIVDGKFVWVRITMGPVGVGPTHATEAEEWLAGKEVTFENMKEAGKLALNNANPRSNPLRGSKEYRVATLPVLVRRALEEIARQAGCYN